MSSNTNTISELENDFYTHLVYKFLKKHRKHGRFEGRRDNGFNSDYPERITKSYIDNLDKYGLSVITRHEANNGEGFWFNPRLEIIDYKTREVIA